MLKNIELNKRASNDSKFNDSKSNDSKSLYCELSYVLFVNDQFGFKDRVHRYLAEVFNDNYTATYYSAADYRGTNASKFKLENLKKPELFDESICAFYAVSKVQLEDRLKDLLKEYSKDLLEEYSKDLLEEYSKDLLEDHVELKFAEHSLNFIDYLVSKLTKSEQQKSNFDKYRIKALDFLEGEKKRERDSSVKDEVRQLLSDEKTLD